MTRRLVLTALVLAGTFACGRSTQQQAAGQVAQGAQQPAQSAPSTQAGAAQAAQGLQAVAQGLQAGQPPAALVNYEDLKGLLPAPDGWERKVRGSQSAAGFASVSQAEGTYTRGDSELRIEIIDAALAQLLLAPLTIFVASGYSERNDDGYTKSITIAGHPAFEKWENGERHAEVTAIVGNRFIVTGNGRGVESADQVRKVVEAVDMAKLAAIK